MSESIQPTPHQFKLIPATEIYQGRKRNITIDQLKADVETNNCPEVLTWTQILHYWRLIRTLIISQLIIII
jgi:hypothetical protein